MKKLINLSLIVVLLLLYSCSQTVHYKAKNLELGNVTVIKTVEGTGEYYYEKGDTVFVDSTNTINNIDSNTMQYLIIKPLN